MPLEVRNAWYAYPSYHRGPAAKSALRGVSLSAAKGEFVGLMGKTGCGKSTLLQVMAGLSAPADGGVFLDGEELGKAGNEKIGIVFQYPENQLFALTAAADVGFALRRKGPPGAEREARIREAFEAVGLAYGEYADVSPLVLSGGEKRRLAIAGVLVSHPEYLLLDEPTAGLDPAGRRDFLSLLDRLNRRGVTILMASHDADAVCEHCGRVVVLDEGRVAEDSPVRESVLMPESPARSLASALRAAGIDVGEDVFRYEELRATLAEKLKGLSAPPGLPESRGPVATPESRGLPESRGPVAPPESRGLPESRGPVAPRRLSDSTASGEYCSTSLQPSFLERMNPGAKLSAFFLLLAAVLLADTFAGFFLVAGAAAAVFSASGMRLSALARCLGGLAGFAVFVFVLNFLFFESSGVGRTWLIFTPSRAGAAQGASIAMRVLILTLLGNALVETTSPPRLTGAIERAISPLSLLRLPAAEIALILGIALRFVPLLRDEADCIRKAQTARGARFDSRNIAVKTLSVLALTVPVFLVAFTRADELSQAMEARGFQGAAKRKKRAAAFEFRDYASLAFSLSVPAVLWLMHW